MAVAVAVAVVVVVAVVVAVVVGAASVSRCRSDDLSAGAARRTQLINYS